MTPAKTSNCLPSWLVLAFTGHRRLEHAELVTSALKSAIDMLATKRPRLAGISSAASGSDTLFAEEMLARGLPLWLVLPFPLERFQKDFADDPKQWERVVALMDKAIETEVVSQTTAEGELPARYVDRPTGSARSPEQKAFDDAGYMDAGYRTIDRADVLIAVWDGKPSRGLGGTAFAVEYARTLERPIILIDPATGNVSYERFDAIDKADADPQPATPISKPREIVEAFCDQARERAKTFAWYSRFLIRLCLQLLLVASALGVAKLAFEPAGSVGLLLCGGEVLILLAAVALMWYRHKNHDLWIRNRVEAEACRAFLATWDIRRHANLSYWTRPPLSGFPQLFRDLRILRQLDPTPLVPMQDAKDRYVRERLDHQIEFLQKQLTAAQFGLKWRKISIRIFGKLALACALVVLYMTWREHDTELPHSDERWLQWVHFFALTLPLVTTWLGLTIITRESVRRTSRYREMLAELKNLRLRLLASQTWDALARVSTEVELVLMEELVEWRSYVRFTRDVAQH